MDHKRIMRFFGAFAILVVLGACAGPSAPNQASTITPGAGSNETVSVATDATQRLVVYSGRNENLVGPLIERFRTETGINVQVRYGETAEMAATILEEGANSPADVFFGQDAGALGALAQSNRLMVLPEATLEQVAPRSRSADGRWVGTSGRARVLVYNSDEVDQAELPQDIWGLTDSKWKGKVGWAPSNGSFQAFVTALRVIEGDEKAQQWLDAMVENDVKVFANNDAIVAAVASGEIQAGLVNHYYMHRYQAEQGGGAPIANHYFPAGGAGALINVAGAGILATGRHQEAARQFLAFLLSDEAQRYFASETDEYPLVNRPIPTNPAIKPMDEIAAPDIDLGTLEDLQGTLELLQRVGVLN